MEEKCLYKLLLLLFIILGFLFTSVFCYYEPIIKECNDSTQEKFNIHECRSIELQVQLDASDTEMGVAEVKFNVTLFCDYETYSLTLLINETASMDECKNTLFNDEWKLHSQIKYYKRHMSSLLPPCNETDRLTFSYIYTGCYTIKMTADGNNVIPKSKLQTKYLSTKYKKDIIKQFNIIKSFRENYKKIFLILSSNNTFNTNYIHLEFSLKKGNIISGILWETECLVNINSIETCNIINSNINVTCTSTRRVDEILSIECELENIEVGNYTLNVTLKNEPIRCYKPKHTVWGEEHLDHLDCTFVYELEISNNTTTVPEVLSENKSYALWMIIITIVIVFIVCIIFVSYVRSTRTYDRRYNVAYSQVEEQTSHNFDILLVYARDCKEVMETMKVFKLVLEQFTHLTHCRVYDMYDLSTEDELSTNPEAWLLTKLSRPADRMKTLLVATRCSEILLQNPNIRYKQPLFHDNLFSLAVDYLMKTNCMNYDSLFVLNFRADHVQELQSFSCFTTGTRFTLPESLEGLLQQLGYEMEESEEVQIFRDRCRHVERVFNTNPTYFVDVLDVKVI